MKVDIAFRTQMTEQVSDEGDMTAILKRDSKGGPNVMMWSGIDLYFKLGPVIFQNIGIGRDNGVTAACYIDRALKLPALPFLHVISSITTPRPVLILHDLPDNFFSKTT